MAESVFQALLRKELAINSYESSRLIARAPHAYKTYGIKKATGGFRIISQPARETKFIMHWLTGSIFMELPVHDCAMAYRKGSSVKKNAAVHARNKYMAKFDFKNFFPSIKKEDIEKHLKSCKFSGIEFDEESFSQIARVCTILGKDGELALSVGSPASPILSNSMMYDFDSKVTDWCIENKVLYTRYADDLAFSTNVKGLSFSILDVIEKNLHEIDYPSVSVNKDKTVYASKKGHRRLTGVVINNAGKLSLGRDKKRKISSMIHKASLGILAKEELSYLQGILGFSKDIEPSFILRMEAKYGKEIIKIIFEYKG
ncbi:retron St85 family RNA-directed DNA polymerase [Halomonas sp. AOP25-F1-15]|uniref:retron St85 family RNA-directed DNA polymerase n=1 Tax=Halomonas sp. AOP25-F1-15 TaxID=3457709 RepID=UPI004034BD6E